MFDFLKSILGSAPEKKVTLAFENVPAFLDEKRNRQRISFQPKSMNRCAQ